MWTIAFWIFAVQANLLDPSKKGKKEGDSNKFVNAEKTIESQFLNLPGTEKRRLCDTLSTAPDRSQEKLIQALTALRNSLNEFGERDSKDENRLAIYLNEETYQALLDLDETSTSTPTELISIAENLFAVLPKDNRSLIEKLSDLFGMENVYGAMVLIVIMSLYVLFKTIGLNQMFSMGIGGLLKITLFFAYLVNLPLNFITEYKRLETEYHAALREPTPAGCFGQEESLGSKFMNYFSTSKILDPCQQYLQRQLEPIYKLSIVGVISQSTMDIIGPALKAFVKHLRGTFDELLDGHSLLIQGIYLTIAVFIIILLFLQISGFKIKISSLLLSFEFGPEKNQDQSPPESWKLAIARLEEITDRNLKLVAANPKDNTKQIQGCGDHQPRLKIENIPLDKRDSPTSSESSFDLLKNESSLPE